jgi:hypothetical protein
MFNFSWNFYLDNFFSLKRYYNVKMSILNSSSYWSHLNVFFGPQKISSSAKRNTRKFGRE